MKNINTIIILTVAISALLFSRETDAQSVIIMTDNGKIVDCRYDKVDREKPIDTIVKEDYPYLRNLECLKNGYFFNSRGLNFELRDMNHTSNSHYVLNGTGATIDVEATYDREGNLTKATLIKKDTQIPRAIMRFIYSDNDYDGWRMTGNEMVVKNFDPNQTEYKVTLSNGDETQVLHFREQVESIAFLDRR